MLGLRTDCLKGGGGSRSEHSGGNRHGGTRSSGSTSEGSESEGTGRQSHGEGTQGGIGEIFQGGGGGYGEHDYGGSSQVVTSNVSGFGGGYTGSYFGESSGGTHEGGKKKILFHMLVYSKENGVEVPPHIFEVFYIPINKNRLNQSYIGKYGLEYAYQSYRMEDKYFHVGIYYEIITNGQLLNSLREQNYSAGIADFSDSAGPFAVFGVLGIQNTFDVSASVFFPGYLQFLKINGNPIDVTRLEIPDFKNVVPAEWIHGRMTRDAKMKYRNIYQNVNRQDLKRLTESSNYNYNELVRYEGIITKDQIPKLVQLFQQIKYHFLNQHKFVNFNQFPQIDKIIYIGGILVEDKGILTKRGKTNPSQGDVKFILNRIATLIVASV
uniref:Uncharacterized protein n=1 Tax=Meloidogyne javanica TaxID=6303 RepID=A0A915MKC6_MELJA